MKPTILLLLGLCTIPASVALPTISWPTWMNGGSNQASDAKPETQLLRLLMLRGMAQPASGGSQTANGADQQPHWPNVKQAIRLNNLLQQTNDDKQSSGMDWLPILSQLSGGAKQSSHQQQPSPSSSELTKITHLILLDFVSDAWNDNAKQDNVIDETDILPIIWLLHEGSSSSSEDVNSQLALLTHSLLLKQLHSLGLDNYAIRDKAGNTVGPDWPAILQQLALGTRHSGINVHAYLGKIIHLMMLDGLQKQLGFDSGRRMRRDVGGSGGGSSQWDSIMQLVLLDFLGDVWDDNSSSSNVIPDGDLMRLLLLLHDSSTTGQDINPQLKTLLHAAMLKHLHNLGMDGYVIRDSSDNVVAPDWSKIIPLLLLGSAAGTDVKPNWGKIVHLMLLENFNDELGSGHFHRIKRDVGGTGAGDPAFENMMRMMLLKKLQEAQRAEGNSAQQPDMANMITLQLLKNGKLDQTGARDSQQLDKMMQALLLKKFASTSSNGGGDKASNTQAAIASLLLASQENKKLGTNEAKQLDGIMKLMLLKGMGVEEDAGQSGDSNDQLLQMMKLQMLNSGLGQHAGGTGLDVSTVLQLMSLKTLHELQLSQSHNNRNSRVDLTALMQTMMMMKMMDESWASNHRQQGPDLTTVMHALLFKHTNVTGCLGGNTDKPSLLKLATVMDLLGSPEGLFGDNPKWSQDVMKVYIMKELLGITKPTPEPETTAEMTQTTMTITDTTSV